MNNENDSMKINLFNKGINGREEVKKFNRLDIIYNKLLFNNIFKILILFLIIIHLLFYLFFNKSNNKLKIRKLNSDYNSIIIITLSIETQGNYALLIDVVDQMPDEIYIDNDINNVKSCAYIGGIESRDLFYSFPYAGEHTVKFVWHQPITSCHYLFYYLTYVTKIDLSKFDSSQVATTENMFYQCQNLVELNLENFNTSQVTNMKNMFKGCLNLTSIDVSKFDTSKVKDMEGLFNYDRKLAYIDLSSFDVSQVTIMNYMFMECFELTSINFGNFNTKNVKTFNAMFRDCFNLLSIDLSSFDTSNAVNMNSMFFGCSKLESIDLSSFQTSNCENIHSIFSGCINLKYIDLSNFDTSKVELMNSMFNGCEKLKYINMGSSNTSSVKNMENMFDGCSSLNYLNLMSYNENDNLVLENIINGISGNLVYCIEDTSKANNITELLEKKGFQNDCSNLCFSENIVYDLNSNSCSGDCSNITKYKYKSGNKCYTNCEDLGYYYSYDLKECITEIPDGFYRKNNSSYNIEKCPIKCKNCSLDSILDNNLCLYCKNSYYQLSVNSYSECYETCPEGYINSIKKTCEIFTTVITESKNYDCENALYIKDNKCVEKCSALEFLKQECKAINNSLSVKTKIINNIRESIKSGNLSSLLSNVTGNNKTDIEIFDKDIIYQITSTFNQENYIYDNISVINLIDCENTLKSTNNIDPDEDLIIFKVDLYEEGLLMPIVEYEVYNPDNFQKLNLSVCKNIEISLPVSINESELFKYNPSSDFYFDKCFTYTSESGTDITLSDRQKEYANYNFSLCEDNCKYVKYNYTTKYATCDCEAKEDINVEDDLIFDKDKLLNSFIDIENMINLEVIKCYSLLFTKDGIIKNIGNYIMLFTIFIFIISLFIFIFKGYDSLMNQINMIGQKRREMTGLQKGKNFISNKIRQANKKITINLKNKEKSKNNKINKRKHLTQKNILGTNSKLMKSKINSEDVHSPPKKDLKKKKKKKKNSYNIFKVKNISSNTTNKTIKNKININININKIKTKLSTENKLKNYSFEEKELKKLIKNNNNIFTKIYDLTDYEKNNLNYNEALKYDNRTYFQFYISLIKTKHLLFFSFYPNRDYNSEIIKICLFFFSFSLFYTINTLFYTDDTIHEIHKNEGKYDFLYQLPQILYSIIISAFINALIKYLSLTQKNIIRLKNESLSKNFGNNIQKVIKCLKIKFILFFVLSFIFLIFFWFYLSCFCAVYKNTQIYVIKDTLISFGLSLLYPFGLNLIPGFFRIQALNAPKKDKELIYKIGKIIQLI